jgi:tRNA pseudouridine55 synthase
MDGSLIIDKPANISSHEAVLRVRRTIGISRVGHAGTLDPFATGVLVVCIGRATRLVQFLIGLDKEYLATIRLGFATDTQDLTGKQITPLSSSNELTSCKIREVLQEFIGPQLQKPPMFSAKQVAGQRLYRVARQGGEIERAPVPITIYAIELVESDNCAIKANEDGTRDFVVRLRCSSGTYVRTLAHDIGRRLGVGAHLAALRRTAVGCFSINQALTLSQVESLAKEESLESKLISPTETLAHLRVIWLDQRRSAKVANGMAIKLSLSESESLVQGQQVRLCNDRGELMAVGEISSNRKWVRPRVVLR